MTDHTGRAGLERVAHEFDRLRTQISVRGTPRELPDLATASKHLATLTGLIPEPAVRGVDAGPCPGWVTATPGLGRPAQLAALGNGVVPQQAACALQILAPPRPSYCHHTPL